MCLKPIDVNGRTHTCGRCVPCLLTHRRVWTKRLTVETLYSHNPKFLTLTYDEDRINYNASPDGEAIPSVSRHQLQKFNKQLVNYKRRKVRRDGKGNKRSIFSRTYHERHEIHQLPYRYYATSEYGERFGRPHYHILAFNLPTQAIEQLEEIWDKGKVYIGEVSLQSIEYVTGYVHEAKKSKWRQGTQYADKPFSVMSRNPGIGYQWLKHNDQYSKCYDARGKEMPTPRYYREATDWVQKKAAEDKFHADTLKLVTNIKRKFPDRNPWEIISQRRWRNAQLQATKMKQNAIL